MALFAGRLHTGLPTEPVVRQGGGEQLAGADAASARFHVRCSCAAPLISRPLGIRTDAPLKATGNARSASASQDR